MEAFFLISEIAQWFQCLSSVSFFHGKYLSLPDQKPAIFSSGVLTRSSQDTFLCMLAARDIASTGSYLRQPRSALGPGKLVSGWAFTLVLDVVS